MELFLLVRTQLVVVGKVVALLGLAGLAAPITGVSLPVFAALSEKHLPVTVVRTAR